MPTEAEALRVIERIEAGVVGVSPSEPWGAWSNLVSFTTTNGWRFVVFNDFGQWDYIEGVIDPEGARLVVSDQTPQLDAYAPSSVDLAMRWGLSRPEAEVLMANEAPGRN
ncbi:MAG: hypothetical protein KDB73_17260 [Planctomycetes bacterium]|nr:hypothetical protein [Planctomycetota bacterium]